LNDVKANGKRRLFSMQSVVVSLDVLLRQRPHLALEKNAMVGEMFAGLSALKSAFDMAKGLKDIDDAARRNAAVIDLQAKILAAQEEHQALLEKVSELKKEIARFETWEAEKKRYELRMLPPGIYVYALKTEAMAGEPFHRVCEKCFHNGRKSILHNLGGDVGGGEHFHCHGCGTDFFPGVGHRGSVESDYDPFWDEDGNPRR
jgi:hypothetical protein